MLSEVPGLTETAVHKICTEDHPPIRSAPYGISAVKAEGVRKEVTALLEMGIIVPSHPWASPVVPVVKPDKSIRLCVDYRKLNAITTPDLYCMPLVEELIHRAGSSSHLSKIDLAKGFYQVPVDPQDRAKTAFISPSGKFEFTQMPFGLRNAPATFQRLVDVLLSGLHESCVPYIDDILIYSADWHSHRKHIGEMLTHLAQHGLTAKPCKCAWAWQTLDYLGHTVGRGVVEVPAARVKAIRDYPRPVTKKQLKSFIGLMGYYRCFVSDFAFHAKPLQSATLSAAPQWVIWTKVREQSFHYLCNVLCSACVLHIPLPQDVFLLQTDASYDGLGACLSVIRNKEELPVAFFSRQLRDPETRYSATEIECLAVVEAIHHFEIFLDGQRFKVQTDHRALEHLFTAKLLNRRLSRWALHLQGFDFIMQYHAGKFNGNADAMSRSGSKEDPSSSADPDSCVETAGGMKPFLQKPAASISPWGSVGLASTAANPSSRPAQQPTPPPACRAGACSCS